MPVAVAFAFPSVLPQRPRRSHRPFITASAARTDTAVLSIDVGTSGTKSGLYSCATGAELAVSYAKHPSRTAAGGVREQNGFEWWRGVASAVRAVVDKAGCSSVRSVAVTGSMQNLALCTGRPTDAPVLGDGTVILYSDARCKREAALISQRLGVRVEPTSLLCKLMYLEARGLGPGAGRLAIGAADLCVFRLCGAAVTDPTNLSTTGLSAPPHRSYDLGTMVRAGLDPGWVAALPAVHSGAPGEVGRVSALAAAELGAPELEGAAVCHVGGDAVSTTFGAGCSMPGSGFYVYVGTSGWVGRTVWGDGSRLLQRQRAAAGVFYLAHPLGVEYSLELASMSSAGACLVWAAHILGEMSVDGVLRLAAQAPLDPSGPTFAPWLSGRRCPDPSPDAAASFSGLSSGAGREHLARAVVDGVCFGLRSCFALVADPDRKDADPPMMTFVGGGAQSLTLAKALSSALGCNIRTGIAQSVGVAGAAAAAMGEIGVGDNFTIGRLESGEPKVCSTAEEIIAYDKLYRRWRSNSFE